MSTRRGSSGTARSRRTAGRRARSARARASRSRSPSARCRRPSADCGRQCPGRLGRRRGTRTRWRVAWPGRPTREAGPGFLRRRSWSSRDPSILNGREALAKPSEKPLQKGGLAADLRHRSRRTDEAAVVDLVLELLVGDRELQELREPVVGGAVAQRRLQIPLAAREKAGPELAVRREADPIAARAERLGDGIDEA